MELALVLPVVAIVILVVLQLTLVMRDAVAVTAAARAGARRAMVDPSPGAVRQAAVGETGLDARRLTVSVGGDTAPGGTVVVLVRYRSPTDVGLVGRFLADVTLTQRLAALRE